MAESPLVVGICNPLLDISADVPLSFFEKYGAVPGTACLAEEKHLPLYAELVKDFQVQYIAGGAGQNSMRAAQWMMQKPGATAYIGSVGKDENGSILSKAAGDEGVTTFYHVDEETPTGTCAVLINEKERCLIANLAAANKYKIDHLLSEPVQKLLDGAQQYYATGFFLTVCPDALVHIGKKAAEANKPFLWNISADFLVNFFWEPFQQVLPYCDILFGNEIEAAAFGKKNGWESEDLKEVAKKTAALPKVNDKRTRIVIFTQGSKPTIVCKDGEVTEYPINKIEESLIVDTNGAGDSFVGGFISKYVLGKEIVECVNAGHYCASKVIQVSGAVYTGKPDFSA
jgi:adenosine kinase